jgi:hypothetical protein
MLQQRHQFFPSRLIIVAILVLFAALIGLFINDTRSSAQASSICRVLLMVDRSGSIGNQMNNYKLSIQSAFLDGGIYDENIDIGFWSFASANEDGKGSITQNTFNDPKSRYVKSKRDKYPAEYNTFNEELNKLPTIPYGPTNYEQGFGYKGPNQTDINPNIRSIAQQADMIVLITDGLPNYPTSDPTGRAKIALSNLVRSNTNIEAILGLLISGQTGGNINALRDIINGASITGRPSLTRDVVGVTDYTEVGGILADKVPERCYGGIIVPGGPSTVKPRVTANPTTISSDASPFQYWVDNNQSSGFSDKTDWSIYRSIKDPDTNIVTDLGVIDSGENYQFPAGSNNPIDASTARTIIRVGSLKKNTEICDRLELNAYKNTTPTIISSEPPEVCVTFIGLQPTFEVRGGDFYVGRHFLTDADKITNSSIDGGGIVALDSSNFSSWAQYGVFATGEVNDFASGAAFRASSEATRHPLTFQNKSMPYGSFLNRISQEAVWSIPDVVATITSGAYGDYDDINRSDLTRLNILSGSKKYEDFSSRTETLSVNGDNVNGDNKLQRSSHIIINTPEADVTIESDIVYTDGLYRDIKQIPQLIIIAKNIKIVPGVSRVDAWLHAKGNDDGGGVVYTCFPVSDARCEDNKLKINGPVIARQVLLNRKYSKYDPIERQLIPAEVINLPATTYLYLLNKKLADNNDQLQFETSWSVELPPYF